MREDGRHDGRFYVDGRDETKAPEVTALGRRRLAVTLLSTAALFGVGLLWTHALDMAFVIVLACAWQGAFLIWIITERLAIGAIRRRHRIDDWVPDRT